MSPIFPGGPKFPLPIPNLGEIVAKIIEFGKKAWRKITGKDEKQDELARQKGLNPEKSDASEIAELNKILYEYRQNISKAAEELEREMILECSMEMQDIMDVFESYNKELKIARSESIKRKFKHLNSELKGTFSDFIERKISLDNPECIKVLKLPAGELKNQRLQEMKQNVFIAAKDEMIDKIKYTVSDFGDAVEDAFLDHLERAEESILVKRQAFEKMSDVSDNNTDSVEAVLLQSDYIISVCSLVDML